MAQLPPRTAPVSAGLRRLRGPLVLAATAALALGCRPRAQPPGAAPSDTPRPSATAPARPDTTPAPVPPPAPPVVAEADAGPAVAPAGLRPGAPTSFAPLVRAVRSSVVSVFAAHREVQGMTWGWGGAPQERISLGRGTGFIISDSGEILTNNHVIEGAVALQVQLDDGRRYGATVLGRDDRLDVALLRLNAPGVRLHTATLGDSDRTEVGDWVLAIGNPYGLSQTVTTGIVSAIGRTGSEVHLGPGNFGNLIQTDASINPGNSGGPLLNLAGEVVGINVAVHRQAQGVGFAIPINMAKAVVPQLRQYGRAIRSWLGVEPAPITSQLVEYLRLPDTRGALVRDVVEGSPAAAGGLQAGDVIRVFDGHPITDHTQVYWLVASAGVGHRARLEILREGRPQTVEITLTQMPEPRAVPMAPGMGMVPLPPGSMP